MNRNSTHQAVTRSISVFILCTVLPFWALADGLKGAQYLGVIEQFGMPLLVLIPLFIVLFVLRISLKRTWLIRAVNGLGVGIILWSVCFFVLMDPSQAQASALGFSALYFGGLLSLLVWNNFGRFMRKN